MKNRILLLSLTCAAAAILAHGPANADPATVVATCGTQSDPVGSTRQQYQATTGNLCTSATGGGGGGGAVYGPTAVGSPAANPPVLVGGTADATATGTVQVQKVDSSGNASVAVTSSALPSGAATAANQATEISSLATIATNSGSAIPAGTAIIGKVGIDQTTPGTTNGVQVNAALPAGTNLMGKVGIDQTTPGTTNAVTLVPATSGGMTVSTFEPGASDNHTNLKNGAGQLYWVTAFNNSATINYIRFYNAATGFNGCNSATNLVAVAHIPANTSDAGFVMNIPEGIPFSTGISYCVVSAYGQATTTSATASAMDINIGYK